MATPLSVFISYAHEDEIFLEKLRNHLTSLVREQLIAGWHDRMITAGGDWEREIKARLENADIIVLLVSSDFTGSEYCVGTEAALAVERWKANKARVVPVIVRPVDWKRLPLGSGSSQTSLGLLNALPKDGQPITLWPNEDQAYENVATGLRAVINDVNRQRASVASSPESTPTSAATLRPVSPPPSQSGRDPVQTAINRLMPFLETDSVTWFLGPRTTSPSLDSSIRDCHIARTLLADLELVDSQWTRLLPPVDVAASYYAVKRGLTTLVNDVTSWIANDAAQLPAVHRKLATLLASVRLRCTDADRRALRPIRRNQQLVITTNIDLMMERALVSAGIPFTRLVQVHSEPRIEATDYGGLGRLDDGRVVLRASPAIDAPILAEADSSNLRSLDSILQKVPPRTVTLDAGASSQTNNQNALESLSLKDFREPILYKLRGSLDVPESCAISSEQYLEFCLNIAGRFVPTQIGTIVQHTPAVFLGFGFLDPDFRLVYYTFLRALTELRKEDRMLYSVQLPPSDEPDDNYRKMELPIWEDLKDSGPRKAKITTLEESIERFLERLSESVDPGGTLRAPGIRDARSETGGERPWTA